MLCLSLLIAILAVWQVHQPVQEISGSKESRNFTHETYLKLSFPAQSIAKLPEAADGQVQSTGKIPSSTVKIIDHFEAYLQRHVSDAINFQANKGDNTFILFRLHLSKAQLLFPFHIFW